MSQPLTPPAPAPTGSWDALREQHKTRSRDHIAATALELAASHGMAAVHMRQLSEAAGVSRATLYKYFPTVREAVDHALAEVARQHTTDLRAAVQHSPNIEESIRLFCRTHIEFIAGSKHSTLVTRVHMAGLYDAVPHDHQSGARETLRDLLESADPATINPEVRADPDGAANLVLQLLTAVTLVGNVDSLEARRDLAVTMATRCLCRSEPNVET